MQLPQTDVSFFCEDASIQRLYDLAEEKCRGNLRRFGQDLVLVEGGGYAKIWLETQPMGGDMYALRSPEAALNNSLLFMRCQRADGRLPGSIRWDAERGILVPEFNKYQGFCFPDHALNLYFLFGRDPAFLAELEETLRRFDACLWRTRALEPDGLLRSFCVYDTGEDLALRYGDAPCWWTEDEPPAGCSVVPMASMDVTSWSFAARHTLAEIARLRGDPEAAADWDRKAAAVRAALRASLWDEARGTLFDRDRAGRPIPILVHNPLRCMYWGSLSRDMADRFVREHLLNPREFWTPFPLPSVAVSNPAFRNAPENNWSGQPEGLTWQRALFALERYGYTPLVTRLGRILFDAVLAGGCRFTQQFDPFTGAPSLVHAETHQPLAPGSREPLQDAYGPTLLSVLGYLEHRWGIVPWQGQLWFSLGSGNPCQVRVSCYGHRYELDSDGRTAQLRLDGAPLLTHACGARLITTPLGEVLRELPLEAPLSAG